MQRLELQRVCMHVMYVCMYVCMHVMYVFMLYIMYVRMLCIYPGYVCMLCMYVCMFIFTCNENLRLNPSYLNTRFLCFHSCSFQLFFSVIFLLLQYSFSNNLYLLKLCHFNNPQGEATNRKRCLCVVCSRQRNFNRWSRY